MKRKRTNREESLQISVCSYIKLQYPGTIFTAEGAGINQSMGNAIKCAKQRSQRGLPDMLIFEPKGPYHGLLIELKREGQSPFLKDGSLSTRKHIQEQGEAISQLKRKGYFACFCVGFDEAKDTIDKYMNI